MILQNWTSGLQQLWQHWFKPLFAEVNATENILLTDEEYETFFEKLGSALESHQITAELVNQIRRCQDDPWFLLWLRRYSHRQIDSAQSEKFLQVLQQVESRNWGDFSGIARQLSQQHQVKLEKPSTAIPLKIESVTARLPLAPSEDEGLAVVAPTVDEDAVSQVLQQAAQQYQTGELFGAIALWGEAIALTPHCPKAYNNRGSALYYLGRYEDAIADFDIAIQQQPDFHLAYNNRGNVYADLGQLQAALADYTQAINLRADFYFAYNGRAGVLARLGHSLWAIADYNQALALNQQFYFAYNNRGKLRAELGQYSEAIADFTQALYCHGDNPDAYHNRGNIYAELAQNQNAIADYSQALALNPNLYQTYHCRGRIYARQQQYQDAIADYDEALNLHPRYTLAYNSRGIAYFAIDQHQDAIADFQQTLAIQPNFWQGWLNWGCVLAATHNDELALQTWQKGLSQLQSTHPDYLQACARLDHYQGKVLQRQAQQRNNSYLYFNAIDCYHNAGRTIQDYPQWRSLYLEILQDLQITYSALGDTEQAQKWRQYALNLLEKLLLETTNTTHKRQIEQQFADLYYLCTQDWLNPEADNPLQLLDSSI